VIDCSDVSISDDGNGAPTERQNVNRADILALVPFVFQAPHNLRAVQMTRLPKSRLQLAILFGMVSFYARLPFVVAEDEDGLRHGRWPETLVQTLVLYRTRPKHSECAGGVGAARRVRYSGLKEASPGEAIMPIQSRWG